MIKLPDSPSLSYCIRGYTAPEYAIYGQLSEKVDIYSYGVVVLEIISGQKCSQASEDPDSEYLLKRVNLYVTNAQFIFPLYRVFNLANVLLTRK